MWRSIVRFRCLSVAVFLLSVFAAPGFAADPSSGTLSPANPEVKYTSGPFLISNPSGVTGEVTCQDPAQPCDDFALTVDLPANYDVTNPNDKIRIEVSWPNPAEDYDVFLLNPDGSSAGESASSSDPEVIKIPAGKGMQSFTVRIVPFTAAGGSTTTKITLGPGAPPAPSGAGLDPRFHINVSPPDRANDAGEPSVGYNFTSKHGMFIAGLETDRLTFPEFSGMLDAAGQALPEACDANWEDVSFFTTSTTSLDPILFTDSKFGRTFVSQLTGANSLYAFTDDDGDNWTPGQLASTPNGGVDHQTTGSGPYPADFAAPPTNPGFAVYYCSQSVEDAFCARSDNGGLEFGPGIPLAKRVNCADTVGALHGHVRVAPDGAVAVPDKECGGKQAVHLSFDAGTSWTASKVPNTSPGDTDPQLAWSDAPDATTKLPVGYFCFVDGDGRPKVTVTKDEGKTWSDPVDLGAPVKVANAVFAQGIAGDPDRAACAFIGTETAGDHNALDFPGIWFPYVATTYDGGATWHVVNISPDDPVQGAGGICTNGTTCGSNRNLLDFNEITHDELGRVLFGYADGCTGGCVQDPVKANSFAAKGTVARQSGGRSLFAVNDGQMRFNVTAPLAPAAACMREDLSGRTPLRTMVAWNAPDDGGAAVTNYQLFRATSAAGPFDKIADAGAKTRFTDTTADPNADVLFYRVEAQNDSGDGASSNVIALPLGSGPGTGNSCVLPGVTVATDPAGDCTFNGCTPDTDLVSLSVAELPDPKFDGQLAITEKVVDFTADTPPPDSFYPILFPRPAMGDSLYVALDATQGAPRFTFGSAVDVGAGLLVFTEQGSLSDRSSFGADGTIVLVVPKTLFGDLKPGDVIAGFDGRARIGAQSFPSRDTIGPGTYTIQGTAVCATNHPPVAALLASTQSGPPPLKVDFTGVADDEDNDSIASYTLDFGDGSDPVTQATPNFSHTYDQEGAFPARLTVKDARDASSTNRAERVIEVKAAAPSNTPPTANLSADPTSGAAPLAVDFDASASSDPDAGDSIASYTFDFGDGSAAVTQTTPTVSHTYAADGSFTATVQVTDSRGAPSDNQGAVQITVGAPPPTNLPPMASLTADPTSGTAPLSVTFDGSGSSDLDPGDRVATYAFDFGDGSPSLSQEQATATHVYEQAGTFTATLTVTDTHGAQGSATAQIQVNANQAPVAQLSANPTSGDTPLSVNFDATASSDPDAGDSIASYTFDFGDGSAAVTQTTGTAMHVYQAAGTFTAKVTVTDTHGASSAPASVKIAVRGAVQNGGGGALGWLTLLPLLGAGLLRKRRARR